MLFLSIYLFVSLSPNDQMTLEALTGDPTVRWGDKSYNSVAFADGTLASTCDVSLFVAVGHQSRSPDDWMRF